MPADAPDGQDPQPVAVLSYKFWQRHYRGDPAVVGKTIQLTHKTYTILGVMPPRFTWRDGGRLSSAEDWNPIRRIATERKIKLKPGVSLAAAEAEFRPLYQEFDRQTPNVFPKQFKISVRGLADTYTRDLKKTMYLLFGAVALLLVIGCGNVSILLLARGTARQHEFAVRSAVGASGFRIVRQLLTESLLLSLAGAGLGVFVAYRAIGFIIPRLPDHSYPYEADFHINFRCPVLQRRPGIAERNRLRPFSRAAIGAAGDQPGDAGQHAAADRRRERQTSAHGPHCGTNRADSAADDGGRGCHSGLHSHEPCTAWL